MPLDDAPDTGLVDEVIALLVTTSARMNQHFTARAAEFGLAPAEGKVLLALDAREALSMRAIARKLGYDPSNLTGVADKLEDRALVTRRPDTADRRVKAVVPTARGLEVREQLSQRLRSGTGPLSTLSRNQLLELRTLLQHANTVPP